MYNKKLVPSFLCFVRDRAFLQGIRFGWPGPDVRAYALCTMCTCSGESCSHLPPFIIQGFSEPISVLSVRGSSTIRLHGRQRQRDRRRRRSGSSPSDGKGRKGIEDTISGISAFRMAFFTFENRRYERGFPLALPSAWLLPNYSTHFTHANANFTYLRRSEKNVDSERYFHARNGGKEKTCRKKIRRSKMLREKNEKINLLRLNLPTFGLFGGFASGDDDAAAADNNDNTFFFLCCSCGERRA